MPAIDRRYAEALDALVAAGKANPDALQAELAGLVALLRSSPELSAVLASPALAWDKKRGLLDLLARRLGLSAIARNFFMVAVHRGRASHLAAIEAAFEQLRLAREGIVRGEIASARELSPAERAALERELAARVGKKLLPRYRHDPALVGGFTARVGDQVWDASLHGRLRRLRAALLAT